MEFDGLTVTKRNVTGLRKFNVDEKKNV